MGVQGLMGTVGHVVRILLPITIGSMSEGQETVKFEDSEHKEEIL